MFTAFITYLLAIGHATGAGFPVAPELGRIVSHCKGAGGESHVWIFKQWHVDPSVHTQDRAKAQGLPQAANQNAIYRQLDRWVGSGNIKTVVAEGCTGELTHASGVVFNGWTVQSLAPVAKKAGYDEIVANVPQKLEAKYAGTLRTLCGDDDGQIREHLHAFSDVRGTYGFLSRLLQHQEDAGRSKVYLDGVVELYKLPPSTTLPQALERLRAELRGAMGRLERALESRNDKVMSVVRQAGKGPVAVVFGGMHAPGLVKRLDALGAGCTVVEPAGYRNDEAALMSQLEAAIKKL